MIFIFIRKCQFPPCRIVKGAYLLLDCIRITRRIGIQKTLDVWKQCENMALLTRRYIFTSMSNYFTSIINLYSCWYRKRKEIKYRESHFYFYAVYDDSKILQSWLWTLVDDTTMSSTVYKLDLHPFLTLWQIHLFFNLFLYLWSTWYLVPMKHNKFDPLREML